MISAVWERSKQHGGYLLVLLALADFADDQGCAWPSVATLSRKARLSERQTRRALRHRIKEGEIVSLGSVGEIRSAGLAKFRKARSTVIAYQIAMPDTDRMSGGPLTACHQTNCPPDAGDRKPLTRASPNPSGNRQLNAAGGSTDLRPAAFDHSVDCRSQNGPAEQERQFFLRAKEVFGLKRGGALASKLLKAKGGNIPLARAALENASTKSDPAEYVGGVFRKATAPEAAPSRPRVVN